MKHARNAGPDIAFRLARRVVSTVADDMSTTQRVVAGAVAALVGISPFGAWNKVEAQAEPLAVGTPVEVGPFEVTIEKAATADELGYLVPEPGNQMLAVVADVTNTTDVPEYSSQIGEAIPAPENVGIIPAAPLGEPDAATEAAPGTGAAPDDASPSPSPSPGETELPSASVVNIEDGTSISILNPGLTYRVALIWEQSGAFSGDEIPLRIMGLEWIEESVGSLDDEYWLPLDEVAFAGQIPVEPAKPAPDAEEGAQ
jgi:hypothetical protein